MSQNVSSVLSALSTAAAVGVGGFFGALARFGTGGALAPYAAKFPWGTLVANLLGCLCIGVVKTTLDRSGGVHPAVSAALVTGFLGAYTTFSTFAFDTVALSRAMGSRAASLYVIASLIGGVALCWIGMRLAR